MTRTQQLPKDLQRYFKELQRDPVRFARDVLGIDRTSSRRFFILYGITVKPQCGHVTLPARPPRLL